MDGNAAMEDDRRMLRRIVALLFALAGLAERLSDRSPPVRCLVLWILRYAESVARDFVIDTALENGASLTPAVLLIPALHGGDTAADAMRLAKSFRALAVLLGRLAEGNPAHCRVSIARMGLTLAACVAGGQPPAGTQFGRRQLCLASSGFAVGRRDSS